MITSVFSLTFGLIALMVRWFVAPADRKRTEMLLAVVFWAFPAAIFAELLTVGFVAWIASHHPLRYDLYVYNIDALLGHPSFLFGRWVSRSPFLAFLVDQVYKIPVVMMTICFVTWTYLRFEQRALVLKAFAWNLVLALPIFLTFPVSGPKFAFPDFPHFPGAIVAHPIYMTAAPNGVPSLHMSIAFLVALLLWPWKPGRVAGVAFVLLTVFTILGNGQHFAFDILCAIPYTWLVWKVAHLRLAAFGFRSRQSRAANPANANPAPDSAIPSLEARV